MNAAENLMITGASGMVGWHLINLLKSRETGFFSTSRKLPKNMDESQRWMGLDLSELRSTSQLGGIFCDASGIIHTCCAVVGKGRVKVLQSKATRSPRVGFGLNSRAAINSFGFSPMLGLSQGISKMWVDSNISREKKLL